MPLPSYVVELQFGASSYVDVTQYVQSISIGRGISRVLDDFSTGTLSVTFVNNERVFDPLNTSSPLWYGAGGYTLVQPAGNIRVSSNSIRRFTGFVQDWDFTFGESGFDGQATVTALDFMYQVANTNFTGGTQYEVEATSDRIKSVMAANGFGTATYADVYGGHTLVGYDINNPGDNVLSYLFFRGRRISSQNVRKKIFFIEKKYNRKFLANRFLLKFCGAFKLSQFYLIPCFFSVFLKEYSCISKCLLHSNIYNNTTTFEGI
jgi:hypothetical protein